MIAHSQNELIMNKLPAKFKPALAVSAVLIIIGAMLTTFPGNTIGGAGEFDDEQAFADLEYQVALGPRIPGSEAHDNIVEWMAAELTAAGWEVTIQEISVMENPVRNVISVRRGNGPKILLGAHYDSRIISDEDPNPENRSLPVPGANDGASGVAVLLGLARALPADLDTEIWLVLFDAEDNGRIPGWDWVLGSRGFVENLEGSFDAAVIVDMVGDADLNIYQEKSSDPAITADIWNQAAQMGYTEFIHEFKYRMIDDHTAFVQAGIPSVLIIDFDYPYWHTQGDSMEHVSARSIKAVGDTLLAWLMAQ